MLPSKHSSKSTHHQHLTSLFNPSSSSSSSYNKAEEEQRTNPITVIAPSLPNSSAFTTITSSKTKVSPLIVSESLVEFGGGGALPTALATEESQQASTTNNTNCDNKQESPLQPQTTTQQQQVKHMSHSPI
jgi:hypothetical protein